MDDVPVIDEYIRKPLEDAQRKEFADLADGLKKEVKAALDDAEHFYGGPKRAQMEKQIAALHARTEHQQKVQG